MKYWKTGEVSKQRNISTRTLRYYDQINLLTPSFKDEYGKRYYSEEDLLKLEKILLLKSLSMPLDDIQMFLEKITYKQLLIAHYNHLQTQLAQLEKSVAHTSTLINMLSLDKELSWEKVIELVENSKTSSKKWIDFFDADEINLIKDSLPNLSNNDVLTQHYINIVKNIEQCIASNIEPNSVEGLEIARKLIDLTNETFQGNEQLAEKFWEVRNLPAEQTGLFPISKEVLQFAEQCINYNDMKERHK